MTAKDEWSIDRQRATFVVIDIQRGYIEPDAPIRCPEFQNFIPKVNELSQICRDLGMPVIFVYNSFRADLSDLGLMQDARPRTDSKWETLEDRPGVKLADGLVINKSDYLVKKNRYSAFAPGASRLGGLLRGLRRDHLIMCGGATDVCLGMTAADAMMQDYKVFIVGDLTATLNKERQRIALEVLNAHFAKVMTFEDTKNNLRRHK